MKTFLSYGSKKIRFEVPQFTEVLRVNEPRFKITKKDFYKNFQSLLTDSYRNFQKISIIVSDKTRQCDYSNYLPWLIDFLESEGAKKENIQFIIAYGTHPKQSNEESLKTYGETFKKYMFIHHNCESKNNFKNLGVTQRGTNVLVRKDLLDSSLIITFGPISHHYFAGFGGGRKLLFPGLGEKKAIYHNHSLFLNKKKMELEPNCKPGTLNRNPVAEDLKEIDQLLPNKLSIYGILNSKGRVCQLHFGKEYRDFISACNIHDKFYKSTTNYKYDLVIASTGGYPKDINFIQTHKSIHNAASFVKNGGSLIVLAQCNDGIGNDTFLAYFKEKNWQKFFKQLTINYEGNGGTALAMKEKTSRINICLLTELDEKQCNSMGIKKINKEEIQTVIQNNNGSFAIIKNASMLIK